MKNILGVLAGLLVLTASFSQPTKIKAEKYPSLLWEITGKGAAKPSYLFGTMHVSSKMVFHLSDSFYTAIRNAQVVALETNPGTWQDDFSRYDLDGGAQRRLSRLYALGRTDAAPQDYLSINTLKLPPYEKTMEAALYSNPSIINSFLYRSNSEGSGDFEEDTYLDLHIFQTGRKLGKRVCGVEDFDGSMQLVKEAYAAAAKDKKRSHSLDYDDDFSYSRMEEAYRTGNLDLLDTINKVNSQSAAFDEKFLYRRNEIQAASIDSILKSGTALFVGVGAAHLPGSRGVIELLRRKGYKLRPIKMSEHNSLQKDNIEKIRVPVQFSKQVSDDGFYSVSVPGKLYSFAAANSGIEMKQYADMVNGSYYVVTRFPTLAAVLGQPESEVLRKLDSVMYENIPGKILSKKEIVKNGYRGYDVINRTRRGDVQRYNIFVTPFELLIFKMSGNGDYVQTGTEATRFFTSIQLKEIKTDWKKWSPASGGFEVELPHAPLIFNNGNQVFAAYNAASKTAVEVIRTGIHNYDFLEEDSFDLSLMEESFAASACIARNTDRRWTTWNGYPALDASYKFNDSSVAAVRFLIQGPHYYTLLASAPAANGEMTRFLKSFAIQPFRYGEAALRQDTALQFRVQSPVALEKANKLQMYPEESYNDGDDADDSLVDNGSFKGRLVENDSTGEKIYVSYFKPSPYFFRKAKKGADEKKDSAEFRKEWVVRKRHADTLGNGLVVTDYELGNRKSSRLLRGRIIARDGVGYKIETEGDTLSAPTAFVSSFFRSFEPLDSLESVAVQTKKTGLFFSHFFSGDTLLHKKAIKNINALEFDSADFSPLKSCIETLSWKEKKYLNVKKDFIGKLASVQSKNASDFLKALYEKAGDTVELQYASLEALLGQQTAYAFQTFAAIMQSDPPVMDISMDDEGSESRMRWDYSGAASGEIYTSAAQNGSFLDHLTDSLQLTAGIIKQLLPLININDYEKPMITLLGTLVDSGLVRPADYEAYLPKFLLEAKQLLKKQLIQEKNKAIAQAKKDEDEKEKANSGQDEAGDFGNNRLSLYATVLLPFWEQNPQVPPLIRQLLQSADKRLRYNTAMLLLRNSHPVADSILAGLAALDAFRDELYGDLGQLNKQALFPAPYKSQLLLARSQLMTAQEYGKPDTLVYLDKTSLQYKGRTGVLYFFKYKEKKEENSWKLASAGLFPADSTRLAFEDFPAAAAEAKEFDFTELGTTKFSAKTPLRNQLDKLTKRLLYSRRKSAAQFYTESAAEFDSGRKN